MKILIEIPDEAEETLNALAFLEGGMLKDLNIKIYLTGLKQLGKENKQLADLLKIKSKEDNG